MDYFCQKKFSVGKVMEKKYYIVWTLIKIPSEKHNGKFMTFQLKQFRLNSKLCFFICMVFYDISQSTKYDSGF